MQRLLNRGRVLDVLRLGFAGAARGTAKDPRRAYTGKEQSFKRSIALDKRAIHLGGRWQQHHVEEDTGSPLLCATGNWTGNYLRVVPFRSKRTPTEYDQRNAEFGGLSDENEP